MSDMDPRRRLSDSHLENQGLRRDWIDRPSRIPDTNNLASPNFDSWISSGGYANETRSVVRKLFGILFLIGLISFVAVVRYQNLSGAEAETYLSFVLAASGYIIAAAIPAIVLILSETTRRPFFILLVSVLACAAIIFTVIAGVQYLSGLDLLQLLVRDWGGTLRQFVSPASLLKQILPQPMAASAWLMAFSVIITVTSIYLSWYGSTRGLLLAAVSIVVGCSLFL